MFVINFFTWSACHKTAFRWSLLRWPMGLGRYYR